MPTNVLDRARAKCGSRDRKCLGGDREAARWHARLQLSLRWHGLEGHLNQVGYPISNHAVRNAQGGIRTHAQCRSSASSIVGTAPRLPPRP